jgi:hypothetical protein
MEGRATIRRLADDTETSFLEQPPSEAPEARMVIDDQDRRGHDSIVTRTRGSSTAGYP